MGTLTSQASPNGAGDPCIRIQVSFVRPGETWNSEKMQFGVSEPRDRSLSAPFQLASSATSIPGTSCPRELQSELQALQEATALLAPHHCPAPI